MSPQCLLAVGILVPAAQDVPAVHDAPTHFLERTLAAYEALDAGDLERAKQLFTVNLERFPEHANSAYALACVAARSGGANAALDWIAKAVQLGYSDADVAAWDPDLAPLRTDARFTALVATMRDAERVPPTNARLDWTVSESSPHFSADGSRVSTCSGGEFAILDARSNEVIASFDEDSISDTGFSRYGPWLAVTRRSAATTYWDAFDGRSLPAFDRGRFWGVYPGTEGFSREWRSPDGARVLRFERRAGPSTIGTLVDARTGKEVATFGDVGAPVEDGGFIDGGRLGWWMNLARRQLHVFDAKDGRELRTFVPTADAFMHAIGDPERGELVTSERGLGLARRSVATGEVVRRVMSELEPNRRRELASPDGRYVAVYQSESAVELFDALAMERLWTIDNRGTGRWTNAASFRGDGAELALSTNDRLTIHDSRTGSVLRTLGSPALDVAEPALAPDCERMLVPCEDGEIRVIELASGRCTATWSVHTGRINTCTFLGDGERVLAGWHDGTLAILDGATGRVVHLIERQLDADWRPASATSDGRRIVARSATGERELLDAESGAVLAKLGPAGWYRTVAFDEVNARIAAELARGVVALWDLETGTRAAGEFVAGDQVCALAFSADGKLLACGTADAGLFLWEVDTGRLRWQHSPPDMFDAALDIRHIAFEADGRSLVFTTGDVGTIRRLDLESAAETMLVEFDSGNPSALIAAPSASGARLYVHGNGSGDQPVLDANSGKTLLDLGSERLWFVDGTRDDRWVVGTIERAVRVFGERLDARYTYIPFEDGGWIVKSESLHCAGTVDALRWAVVVRGDETYPFASCASELLDPKRVRAVAAGVNLRAANLGTPPKASVVGPAICDIPASADTIGVELEVVAPRGIAACEVELDGVRFDELATIAFAHEPTSETTRATLRLPRKAGVATHELRLILFDRTGLGSRVVRARFVAK